MTTLPLSTLGERWAFLDPAGSKKKMELKRVRARSAIVVVAADPLHRFFVLHAWADRTSTESLIERVFEINAQYRPRVFGCEANAMQSLFADSLALQAKQRAVSLPLIPVIQPTNVDKDWRIRTTVQPVVAEGRLFLQDAQHELRSEIVSFPMSATKDLIDALASAISLIPPRPPRVQRDTEREALATYLRDAGVEPHRIETRLAEYDAELEGVAR